MNTPPTGSLYIVATPIGHLEDITLRAINTLKAVDLIAAEDTRVAQRLLTHYQITTPVISCHEHNEDYRAEKLLNTLKKGQSVALISDAGTPLINDPGYTLVHQAHQQRLPIIPIPGPCAAIAALTASGLPTDRFSYEGFLPKRSSERKKRLNALLNEPRSMIFYESPYRLKASVEAMNQVLGANRPAALAKELTKIHETIYSDTLAGLQQWIHDNPDRCRGEFILIVQGHNKPQPAPTSPLSAQRVLALLTPHLPLKTAAAIGAEITGIKKNQLYKMALTDKSSP